MTQNTPLTPLSAYLTPEEAAQLIDRRTLKPVDIGAFDHAALLNVLFSDKEELFLKMWERGYPGIIDMVDGKKPHTLYWAVAFNSVKILRCMLSRGIDIDTPLVPGQSDNVLSVIKILENENKENNSVDSLATLKTLIEFGADIYKGYESKNQKNTKTIFDQICASHGLNTELFDYLLPLLREPYFTAPLLQQTYYYNQSVFEVLLEEGYIPRAQQIIDATPDILNLQKIQTILTDLEKEQHHYMRVLAKGPHTIKELKQNVIDKQNAIAQKQMLEKHTPQEPTIVAVESTKDNTLTARKYKI